MTKADNKSTMTDKDLRAIITKGILAPSGDNTQPWKFRLLEDGIELYVTSGPGQHFFETGYRTLYFSAGAVIENMRVAAARMGLRLVPAYFPNPSNPLLVATARFERGDSGGESDDALERRATNRKFYHPKKKIDASVYSKLSAVVSVEKGFRLLWITREEPAYSKVCRLIGDSDQIRFENKKIYEDLPPVLRFNPREVDQTRDGLDLRTFETGPGGFFLFKLISSWNRLKCLNYLGMSRQFNLYARWQMMSSQACGLVAAPGHGPADYVLGGEVTQRAWHEITQLGLSIQPMEALPVFTVNLQLNGGRDFDETQKMKVKQLKDELYSLYGLPEQSGAIFLFRIGYADPPSARSLRRPLESFLV